MNRSSFGDLNSGFSTSDEVNRNFSFNTPLVPQSSGRVRRRLVKVRKQSNAQHLKSAGPTGGVPGFNPFRSAWDNAGARSAGSEAGGLGPGVVGFGRRGNEAFVFGTSRSGLGSADSVSSSVGTGVEFVLPDDFDRKLSVKGSGDTDSGNLASKANDLRTFQFGGDEGGGGASSSMVGDSFFESSANALHDRMKSMNIKDFVTTNRVENDRVNFRTKHEDGFAFGSTEGTKYYLGADRANTLSNEMEKKVNIENVTGEPSDRKAQEFSYSQVSAGQKETGNCCDKKNNDTDKSLPAGFTFQAAMHDNDAPGTQVPVGMMSADRSEKTDGFSFTSGPKSIGTPFFEFKTPNAKINQLSGLNQKLEFSAKREIVGGTKVTKRKDKLKHPTKLPMWPVQDSVSKDDGFQVVPEPYESYSPMDVSPYRETAAEDQCSGEHSVASNEFLFHNNNRVSAETPSAISNDASDEDLVAATKPLDINEPDVECGESEKDGRDYGFDNIVHPDGPAEECISAAETESFKSAYEEIDSDNAVNYAETESSSSNIDRQDSDARMQSDLSLGGHDTYNSAACAKTPHASSSVQFSPLSEASSILSSGFAKKENVAMPPPEVGDNARVNGAQEIKKLSNLIPSATVAAQEACEKWRLRGNQAYSNGDLSKAEDYYTQGINCVPESETSRSCLGALMLCHSNRAATRMSLGRMRDALGDCMRAIAIDPNFLKVQVRAANCYVALGEVEDAS